MVALKLVKRHVSYTSTTRLLRGPPLELRCCILMVLERVRVTASEITILQGSVFMVDIVPDLHKFLFSFLFLLRCGLGLLLQIDKLSSEYFLLLRHLILKLPKLFLEIGLQGLADVLNDLRLVNGGLTVVVEGHHIGLHRLLRWSTRVLGVVDKAIVL